MASVLKHEEKAKPEREEHVEQAEENAKAKQAARAVCAGARKHAGLNGQQANAMAQKNARPPFWDSKKHGNAYGAFNRAAPQRKKQEQDAAGFAIRKKEEEPPYMHKVHAGAKVADVYRKMRCTLKRRRALHRSESAPLEDAVKSTLGSSAGDVLTVDQFLRVWRSLGVQMDHETAEAVFNHAGQDKYGRIPWRTLAEQVLVGQNRLAVRASGVKYGAFKRGEDFSFNGKILYPQCRKGVFPPSDWDGVDAERSLDPPDHTLKLAFVFGYGGLRNNANNLFYTSDTRTHRYAYYTAGVGIVCDKGGTSQTFFKEHDDDIHCMAISQDRTLVATGQRGSTPVVCLWRCSDCKLRATLQHGRVRWITALAFSRNDNIIASVGADNQHTVHIWDWQSKKVLAQTKGCNGLPPHVHGAAFNPYKRSDELITWGVNHIKWWVQSKESASGAWKGESGSFGKIGAHTVCSAACLPPYGSKVVTGSPNGELCIWSHCTLMKVVPAHAKGQLITRADGSQAHNGVRCLVVTTQIQRLFSAGGDGAVLEWDISSGDLSPACKVKTINIPSAYGGDTAPLLRGLDCTSDAKEMVVGTHSCDVWEIDWHEKQQDGDISVAVHGHAGTVYAIDWHPTDKTKLASASEASRLFVWNVKKRTLAGKCNLKVKLRAVKFSPSGEEIAVGDIHGGLHFVKYKSLAPTQYMKPFLSAIEDIKYSPDGALLAAGGHDLGAVLIETHGEMNRYMERVRCVGHSSTITHLDFSESGGILMTNSASYEILYFDTRNGKQVQKSQRDTEFSTWTSILGFPVMGIWPPASDGTDVNSVDRFTPNNSPTLADDYTSNKLLAVADDYGSVRLANYPCVVEHAECEIGRGHSSHVAAVRARGDGKWLASAGSRDRAIFLWEVVQQDSRKKHTVRPPWAPDE